VITLALGIGATPAIFSSVYSLMLKPLPFQEPDRVVELYSSAVKAGLNHMPANVAFLSLGCALICWRPPRKRWMMA
jgi:putative ABC transport system permease protein